jgi:hypothetical protein
VGLCEPKGTLPTNKSAFLNGCGVCGNNGNQGAAEIDLAEAGIGPNNSNYLGGGVHDFCTCEVDWFPQPQSSVGDLSAGFHTYGLYWRNDGSGPNGSVQAYEAFTNANDAAADLETAEAAYGTVPPELFARAKNLRWICAARAGLGGAWFYDALVKSDVVVTNMRGSYNEHLAAHAVAFLLAFARRFYHYLRQKRWQRGPQMIDLPAQTVLIVGVGGAGGEASKLCAAFGMRVLGIDPRDQGAARYDRTGWPRKARVSARRGGFRDPNDTRNTGNGRHVQYEAVRTDEAAFILH